jgi:hypothetical protein
MNPKAFEQLFIFAFFLTLLVFVNKGANALVDIADVLECLIQEQK